MYRKAIAELLETTMGHKNKDALLLRLARSPWTEEANGFIIMIGSPCSLPVQLSQKKRGNNKGPIDFI